MASPTVATKEDSARRVGGREREWGNSSRSSRDEHPWICLPSRWVPYCGSRDTSRWTWPGIVSASTMVASYSARTHRESVGGGLDSVRMEEIVRYTYRLRPGAHAEQA